MEVSVPESIWPGKSVNRLQLRVFMTLASWDGSHYDRMPVHTKLPIISKPHPALLSSLLKQEPGLWPWPWQGASCTVYTSNWFTPQGIWKCPCEASSVNKIMYTLVLDFCLQLAIRGTAMVRTYYLSDQTETTQTNTKYVKLKYEIMRGKSFYEMQSEV